MPRGAQTRDFGIFRYPQRVLKAVGKLINRKVGTIPESTFQQRRLQGSGQVPGGRPRCRRGLSPYLEQPDGGQEGGMAQLPNGPVERPGSIGLIHDPPRIPTGRSAAHRTAAHPARAARAAAGHGAGGLGKRRGCGHRASLRKRPPAWEQQCSCIPNAAGWRRPARCSGQAALAERKGAARRKKKGCGERCCSCSLSLLPSSESSRVCLSPAR